MAVQGVTYRPGVQMTSGLEAYVRVLRGSLQSAVPLTITSGVRTAEKQAEAMLTKLNSGDDLHALYGNDALVARLIASGKNATTWAKIIQDAVAKGASISRHMGGGSFDVHTKTLTDAQVGQIKAAVQATGGRYLHESIPPHLHVDVPAKFAVGSLVDTAKQQALTVATRAVHSPYAWGMLGVSAVLLGVAIVYSKRGSHGPEKVDQAQASPPTRAA